MLGKRAIHYANDKFTKSLCILLTGIWAATSRHVISSTLAHLIVSQHGSRFTFSHDFGHLLVTQLEVTLEGHPVDVRVRTTKVDGETYFQTDLSSEDYIHRPTSLKDLCSYKVTIYYKKVLKPKNAIKKSFNISSNTANTENYENDKSDDSDDDLGDSTPTDKNFEFLTTHPGYHVAKLTKLKNWVVPMMYYDGVRVWSIFSLCIQDNNCDENTTETREDYAKTALLMFHPLQKLDDIMMDGSYWKLFYK